MSRTGNSYPSPVSTSSPDMNEMPAELPPPETITPLPDSSFARDHAATQNTLREASDALRAAYRRIRQVRRSLIEFSAGRVDSALNEMAPAHDALLLTGSPDDHSSDAADDLSDIERLRSSLAESAAASQMSLEMLRQQVAEREMTLQHLAERSFRSHELPLASPPAPVSTSRELAGVGGNTRGESSSQVVPSNSPARQALQPRRSMLEIQLARRREALQANADDPSTSLGRRVAAREANGVSYRRPEISRTSPSDEGPELASLGTSLRNEIQVVTAEIQLRALARQRRTDPGLTTRGDFHGPRAEAVLRAARSLDNTPNRGQPPVAFRPGLPATRRLRMRPETRQNSALPSPTASTPSQQDRLSLLSNISVQNLPTPSSAVYRDRPILFDEPSSYVQTPLPVRRESQDTADTTITTDGVDGRSYLIRRQVGPNGYEHIHNISLVDWEDDDPVWGPVFQPEQIPTRDQIREFASRYRRQPRFDAHRRNETAQPAGFSQTMDAQARTTGRRGWARLDPDGNEIPSEEEEELERARSEYRMRALVEAREASARTPNPGSQPLSRFSSISDLVTRTVPDEDGPVMYMPPRVRLNPHDPRPPAGSMTDSVISVDGTNATGYPRQRSRLGAERPQTSEPQVYGSATPFVVNPLPMPLEVMLPPHLKPTRQDRRKVIQVHQAFPVASR